METVDPKSHWEKVYQTKHPTEVSWYRPHLDVSLELIEEAARNRDARVIDVGGGESTSSLRRLVPRVRPSAAVWTLSVMTPAPFTRNSDLASG